MKTRRLYGIALFVEDPVDGCRQRRVVINATSRASAIRLCQMAGIQVSTNHFRQYAAIGQNEREMAICNAEPRDGVWYWRGSAFKEDADLVKMPL